MSWIKDKWDEDISMTFDVEQTKLLKELEIEDINNMTAMGISAMQGNDWTSVFYGRVSRSRGEWEDWGEFGYTGHHLNFSKIPWEWECEPTQITDTYSRFFWGWSNEKKALEIINEGSLDAIKYLTSPKTYITNDFNKIKIESETKERMVKLSIIRWSPIFPNAVIVDEGNDYHLDFNYAEESIVDDGDNYRINTPPELGLDTNNWAIEGLVDGLPIFQLGFNYVGFSIMKDFNKNILNKLLKVLNLKVVYDSEAHKIAWGQYGKKYFNTKENYLNSLSRHELSPCERFVENEIEDKKVFLKREKELRKITKLYVPQEALKLIENNAY